MFGGLEVKGSAPAPAPAPAAPPAAEEKPKDDVASTLGIGRGSAFSFMSSLVGGSSADPPPPAPAPAPAPTATPSSGFGFMNSTPAAPAPAPAPVEPTAAATTDEAGGNKGATSSVSSGFGFITSALSSDSKNEEAAPAPAAPAPAASSFGFMNAAAPTSPAAATTNDAAPVNTPAESNDSAAAPAPATSSFGFMNTSTASSSNSPEPTPSSTPAPHEAAPAPPAPASNKPVWGAHSNTTTPAPSTPSSAAPSSSTTSSNSDILSLQNSTSPQPAAAAASSFGAAKKRTGIKRRARSKVIGVAASQTPAPAPAPATTSQGSSSSVSLPPPEAMTPSSTTTTKLEENNTKTTTSSERDAAEDARKRAEEFMNSQIHTHTPSNNSLPTTTTVTKEEDGPPALSPRSDKTYAAAKAAAEEAKQAMDKEDSFKRTPFGSGKNIMTSIFGKKPLPFFGQGEDIKHSNSGTSDGGSATNEEEHRASSTNVASEENDPLARIQREQEEWKRASAERELAALRLAQENAEKEEKEIQLDQSEDIYREAANAAEETRRRLAEEEARRKLAEAEARRKIAEAEAKRKLADEEAKRAAAKAKEPVDIFESLLADFAESTRGALDRISQLRKKRSILLVERAAAEKQQKLAAQQVQQAEEQQMTAAEEEDFDLADRLADIIDAHSAEKVEQEKNLENITQALSEIDANSAEMVQEVTNCFCEVKAKLVTFKSEQASVEQEDETEALEKFSAASKHLSAENERLINDLKHIEKHEGLVAEEKKEVEANISAQTGGIEKTRDEAREKLDVVNASIEELKKQLAEKEKESMELLNEITSHESAIDKIRDKFSRQLTRVCKKEESVKENRIEWEADKAVFEKTKEEHEAEVEKHSEALLVHEEMMKNVDKEVANAEKLGRVVADVVVLDVNTEVCKDNNELLKLQEEVVKCEAAVDETQQLVLASEAAVESLRNEAKEIKERIPVLETEKKTAAAKRDFRAAGKANKAIKEAAARKERIEEELAGEVVERVATAKADLKKLTEELETKKSAAYEKEKESGVQNMRLLAQKIKQLERIKKRVCGDGKNQDKKSVSSIGAVVLDQEIENLKIAGETLGTKFGSWDSIKKEVDEMPDPEDDDVESDHACNGEKSGADHTESEKSPMNAAGTGEEEQESDSMTKDVDKTAESDESNATQDSDNKEVETNESSGKEVAIKKFKALTKRVQELEIKLEEAVEREDYDEAAELDQEFQELKSEMDALGLSDSEIELLTECEDSADEQGGEGADSTEVVSNGSSNTESNEKELNGHSNSGVKAEDENIDDADKQT